MAGAQTGGRRMPAGQPIPVSFEWGGQPWSASMRIDVPSRYVDALFGTEGTGVFRDALRRIVAAWDFVDEEGNALPIPSDAPRDEKGNVVPATDPIGACPYALLNALAQTYIDALTKQAEPPKESAEPSGTT